jgi:predicted nucleic acid-binding protein
MEACPAWDAYLVRRKANRAQDADSLQGSIGFENDFRRTFGAIVMLLYLDTSCIAKLFLQEPDSLTVRNAVEKADALVTSFISYLEMHSVIARNEREKKFGQAEAKRIRDVFETDWAHYGKVPVDAPILNKGKQLLAEYPLRTLDAIQLASALEISSQATSPLIFLTADKRLEAVARHKKLRIQV